MSLVFSISRNFIHSRSNVGSDQIEEQVPTLPLSHLHQQAYLAYLATGSKQIKKFLLEEKEGNHREQTSTPATANHGILACLCYGLPASCCRAQHESKLQRNLTVNTVSTNIVYTDSGIWSIQQQDQNNKTKSCWKKKMRGTTVYRFRFRSNRETGVNIQ